jgi:putative SOS response-associated peptidase YedK
MACAIYLRKSIICPATTSLGQLQLPLRYNVAPTQLVPVVRQTDAGRELSMMRWGLVPSWADDPKIGYKLINARSEEAATKPPFRSAMKKRRSLIPADGYYEQRFLDRTTRVTPSAGPDRRTRSETLSGRARAEAR